MSSLLVISANPKDLSDSYSKKMGYTFVENYKKAHPDDTVTIKDLYQTPPPFLTAELITDIMSESDTPIKSWVKEFMSHDKYVIISPMWNLSTPAILKAYIDLIVVKNITFKYTEKGVVGLLTNKKVALMGASGGYYSAGSFAGRGMNLNYLKNIFSFLEVPVILQFSVEGINFNKTVADHQFLFLTREIENAATNF